MRHFEIEKEKKEREKQQFIITHTIHIQTVKRKLKQFIHPSKPIRIDC